MESWKGARQMVKGIRYVSDMPWGPYCLTHLPESNESPDCIVKPARPARLRTAQMLPAIPVITTR